MTYPDVVRRLRSALVAAAASILVVAATGCAGSQPAEPAEIADAYDCLAAGTSVVDALGVDPALLPLGPPAPGAGSVPEGFDPVDVVLCEAGNATVELPDGVYSAVDERHFTGDPEALVAALAEPSDARDPVAVCTAIFELRPELYLVDGDGRVMRASWPVDRCGQSKPGTRAALDGLEESELRRLPVLLLQSRAALDAGCAQTATGPAVGADPAVGAVPGGTAPAATAVTGAACRYTADPVDPPEPGLVVLPEGGFADAVDLAPDQAAELLAALAAPAPDTADCDVAATRFAVVPLDAGSAVVELDGCARLVAPDGTARPAPAPVVAALGA